MQNLRIPLRPGSMRTDVSQNDLGENVHYLVQNLKQTNKNEWSNVRGYVNVISDLNAVLAGIEITDDLVNERFLVLQIDTDIWRLDYNNGYSWDNREYLALPSGISIPAGEVCKFFYSSGVLRITGTTETSTGKYVALWYSYIERTFERYNTTDLEIADWYLLKATVDLTDDIGTGSNFHEFETKKLTYSSEPASFETFYVKYFFILDGGQYGLLKNIYNGSKVLSYKLHIDEYNPHVAFNAHFQLQMLQTIIQSNPRITGIGIVIGSHKGFEFHSGEPIEKDTTVSNWKVIEIIDFTNQEWRKLLEYDCTFDDSKEPEYDPYYDTDKVIYIRYTTKDTATVEGELRVIQSYFISGCPVKVKGNNGTVLTTVHSNMAQIIKGTNEQWLEVYFTDSVQSCFSISDRTNVAVEFYFPRMLYESNYWIINVLVDLINVSGYQDLSTFCDFPAGTSHINPQYSQHVIIADRAYVLSKESDEIDIIRFSPLNQFDVFPQLNIIQSPAGDLDNNKAITERDGRFIIIKGSSISQGHYVGNNYYYDKYGISRGMYPDNGFIVIDDILYVMDKDDIYQFTGTVIRGWLHNEFLRSIYVNNVDSNSFFGYNHIDKEIWIFLKDYILVYNFEFNEWYYRKTDINPLFAFIDVDRKFYVGYSGGIVQINHDESTYDESIECKFISGFVDLKRPEHYKKLRKINFRVAANPGVNVTISARDPNESTTYLETKSAESTEVKNILFHPNMFFKELEVTAVFTASNNPKIKIKSSDLVIGAWRHV